jgi:hypothetical protein
MKTKDEHLHSTVRLTIWKGEADADAMLRPREAARVVRAMIFMLDVGYEER